MHERLDPLRLDELWDFNDPETSADRFRREPTATTVAEAELATQRARAVGLAGRGDEAHALLDGLDVTNPIVATRVALERARLLNSAGRPAEAVPLFAEALRCAELAGDEFLAVDALHMLAIADPENSDEWTARGIRAVENSTDARTQRWRIALHNNRGWRHFDAGRFTDALDAFELAAAAARDHGTAQQQLWAQEAIDEARQALTAQQQ